MDDENYTVNPYARHEATQSSMNDNGSVSVSLKREHRENNGFGSTNLE
jgi:hypothetical protein